MEGMGGGHFLVKVLAPEKAGRDLVKSQASVT